MDTEADSLHSFREKLCLLQFSCAGQHAIIDPLKIQGPRRRCSTSSKHSEVWMHGADFDMSLFKRTFDRAARVLDTQMAARLCGFRQFGLAHLVQRDSSASPSRNNRSAPTGGADRSLRRWSTTRSTTCATSSRWPTSSPAAARLERDVDLVRAESCRGAREPVLQRQPPDTEEVVAHHRMGQPPAAGLAALRAIWHWRNLEAERLDRPAFKVLNNEALLDLAHQFQEGGLPELPARFPHPVARRFHQALEAVRKLPPDQWPRRRLSRRAPRRSGGGAALRSSQGPPRSRGQCARPRRRPHRLPRSHGGNRPGRLGRACNSSRGSLASWMMLSRRSTPSRNARIAAAPAAAATTARKRRLPSNERTLRDGAGPLIALDSRTAVARLASVMSLDTVPRAVRRRTLLAAIPAAALVAIGSAHADARWPQFRGPESSGVADDARPPAEFGPEKAVVWKTAVPPGVSSPIVWDERIFLTGIQNARPHLLCLDRRDGRLLWQRAVPADELESVHQSGGPASATPVTDGQRVIGWFPMFGLMAWDLDGNELWRQPVDAPFVVNGSGTSPILADGRLILCCDQQGGKSFLLAADPATGKTLWQTARPQAVSGYTTPVVWRRAAGTEVVIVGSLRVAAYRLEDGIERWSAGGLEAVSVCPTPVIGDGHLHVMSRSLGGHAPPGIEALPALADKDRNGRLSRDEVPFLERDGAFDFIDASRDGFISNEELKSAGS